MFLCDVSPCLYIILCLFNRSVSFGLLVVVEGKVNGTDNVNTYSLSKIQTFLAC